MTKTAIPKAAHDYANDLLDDPQALVRLLADNPHLLPKPEPKVDRLALAARDCAEIGRCMSAKDAARQIRNIIAREVAAAEPSDEALRKFESAASLFNQWRTTIAVRFDGLCEREVWLSINAAFDKLEAARAALKREGA